MGSCILKSTTSDSIRKVHHQGSLRSQESSDKFYYPNPSRIIDLNYQKIPNKFKRLRDKPSQDNYIINGLIGLQNLGNTCFINAALQSLSNTQTLVDYIMSGLHTSEINDQNPLSSKGVMINSFAKIINQIWARQKVLPPPPLQPIEFLNCLSQLAPQFSGGTQEDAHEFLAFLLDLIHEDLNRVRKKPYITEREYDREPGQFQAEESWRKYLERNRSVIVDLFQGQQKSVVKCLTCGHQSHRFEPFMYLSVPVFEEQNQYSKPQFVIEDAVKEYCREAQTKIFNYFTLLGKT